jgi:hypothetical protein
MAPPETARKIMKPEPNTEAAETVQTTDSPAVVHERLVVPLHWVAGPAMGGTSTAGARGWYDGDLLMIIIHHPDSRTVAMIQVSADGNHLNMFDPNTQDDITEWGFDDIAWWATIEAEQLPPFRHNADVMAAADNKTSTKQTTL